MARMGRGETESHLDLRRDPLVGFGVGYHRHHRCDLPQVGGRRDLEGGDIDPVQAAFIRALADEGLAETIEQRSCDGSVPYDPEDDRLPVLLVMSDNGPQMTSGSTREFMSLSWLATHYGRPGTPTDQAWIESFFGHLKGEFPHLDLIADIDVLRAELDIRRHHYNHVRLHASIGYVTPDQQHRGRGKAVRAARKKGLAQARQLRIEYNRSNKTRGPDHAV